MAGIRGLDYIDENGNRVLTGGLLAKAKNLEKNPNHYVAMGHRGGSRKVEKGFACMTYEKRAAAGRLGGTRSRRISKAKV